MMGTEVSNSSDGLLANPSELYARGVSSFNLACSLSTRIEKTFGRFVRGKRRKSGLPGIASEPLAAMKTNYQILGISQKATPEQIKQSYRTLVKSCHPDLFVSGSEEQERAQGRIREINAAYAILSDPRKRTAYDAKLSKRRSGCEPKPEYCCRCGKPTLYWDIERDKALCNDCGRARAAATGFD